MVKIIISPPRHRPPRCPHGAGPVSTSPPPPTPSAAASNTSRSFRRTPTPPHPTARTTRRRGGRGRWRSCTLEGKPWKAMEKLGEKVGTYGCIWCLLMDFCCWMMMDEDHFNPTFFVGGKPWRVNLLGVFAFTCFWDFCWRVPGLGQRLLHVRMSCRCKL